MAIICREHRLLFIMVPATGCSSLGQVLINELGGQWLPEQDIKQGEKTVLRRKHNAVEDLLKFNLLSRTEIAEYLVFATIRNPFDRLASEYQRLIGTWTESLVDGSTKSNWFGGEPTAEQLKVARRKKNEIERARTDGFDNWVRRKVTSRRLDRLGVASLKALIKRRRLRGFIAAPYPMTDGASRLLRFENLQGDFDRLLADVGIHRQIVIPRKNATPGKKPYQEYYTPRTRRLVERYWGREIARHGYSFDGVETPHVQAVAASE